MKIILSQIAFACCATAGLAAQTQPQRLEVDDYYEATYQVPVQSSDLTTASTFSMEPVQLDIKGDHVKMQYLVPIELTGEENTIELEGDLNQGQGTLKYGDKSAACSTDKSVLSCSVAYDDLKFNAPLAEKFLGQKFSGLELDKRISVQRGFSTDPVGIVQVKLQ